MRVGRWWLGSTLLALAALGSPSARAAGKLRLDFIDVGQGDAALVTSPTGKTVLIDGGPRKSSAALLAFLTRHTRGPLDLILLTHRHEDHLGGLAAAVREIGARQFLDAPIPHAGTAYTALLRALQARGVVVRQATRGRRIDLGGGAEMTLIGPPEPPIVGSRSDVNANSVVARVSFGKFAALFAGDAEAPTEAWLLSSNAELAAAVLKVPHHGSRYASGVRFLRAVGARIAIISAGAGNDYGHPAPQTLERLARGGASVYRTDQDGDVAIESDGRSIAVRAAQGRRETLEVP
jgi:beta-lactamase superfamily II metal-dependent hydrolase